MKIAILGFGKQGRSAYEYWSKTGNHITICDSDEALRVPDGAGKKLGNDYLEGLDGFDLSVRSPGIHPREIKRANAPGILEKVTTPTDEFFRVCPAKNIIGVTGTKGKGTTSTLIAKMLEAGGRKVHLGGNIGTPPLELLKNDIKPDDWVVLELANYQLIDLKYSPHIAVCVMVAPEHLDWHDSLDEYFTAKKQMFIRQKPEDIAIYYGKNEFSRDIANASNGKKIPYYQPPGAIVENDDIIIDGQSICSTNEIKLLGRHNWQNICAATTATWQVMQNIEAIHKVATTFSGLPFRLELRREVKKIRYYNDSFAAAPDATIAALKSIPGPKVMIIGGYERNLDLKSLIKACIELEKEIRKILLIGASAERIANELEHANLKNYIIYNKKDMEAIVRKAAKLCEKGDAVVLSPGFPSFDMFKNFEDRGRQFNRAVESL